MKKVLILAAVFALAAGQAWALSSVVFSKHNMVNGVEANNAATGTTEVCVFCHTPHGAATNNPNAPLWNRSDSAGAISSVYNSATLNAYSKTANVLGQVNNSDAPLCLSCHIAGKIESTALLNAPNGSSITYAAGAGDIIEAGDSTDIGVDLSNDHPIGMIYNLVADDSTNEGAGFNTFTEATGTGNIKFYPVGSKTGVMWCSSCHDVHDDSNYPFLATSNNGSGLCLKCHNK